MTQLLKENKHKFVPYLSLEKSDPFPPNYLKIVLIFQVIFYHNS